jgi:uncharacterized membrane protein YobD (UPF0266 family)
MMTFSEVFIRIAIIVMLFLLVEQALMPSAKAETVQVISKKKSLSKACLRLYKRKAKNYATVCEKRGIHA